jgi:hypothetical protein
MRRIGSSDGVRRLPRLLAAGVLVTGLAVAGTARAAEAASCTTSSGVTSVLEKVSYGEIAVNGTTWTKPSGSGCKDLNLIGNTAGVTTDYEGWLFSSATQHWTHCAAGAIPVAPGSHAVVVLCSGVAATTPMRVSTPLGGKVGVTVEF